MFGRLNNWIAGSIILAGVASAAVGLRAAPGQDDLRELAVEGDWSILRRPNGACLAVPVGGAAAPLSLVFAAGPAAVIHTPYEAGVGGFVILKVDRSDPLYITSGSIPDPSRIEVPADLIPEMWAGRMLVLEIDPLDSDPVRHEFSLVGLSAAVDWFDNPRCRPETGSAEQ